MTHARPIKFIINPSINEDTALLRRALIPVRFRGGARGALARRSSSRRQGSGRHSAQSRVSDEAKEIQLADEASLGLHNNNNHKSKSQTKTKQKSNKKYSR